MYVAQICISARYLSRCRCLSNLLCKIRLLKRYLTKWNDPVSGYFSWFVRIGIGFIRMQISSRTIGLPVMFGVLMHFIYFLSCYFLFCIYKSSNSACQREKNREPVQPTTRSKRQPSHHDGVAASNPQVLSAPISIDHVAPTQTTISLLVTQCFTCKMCEIWNPEI